MAHPYHHAVSSQKKWGGQVENYQAIHDWIDASKECLGDFRHRALRHHAQGIFDCERVFGLTIEIELRYGKDADPFIRKIPVRWIAERHVIEDCGRIPSMAEWFQQITPLPWMNKRTRLSEKLSR
jgi:hypothetical protein